MCAAFLTKTLFYLAMQVLNISRDILLLLFILLPVSATLAQDKKIDFEEVVHNFGEINEADGPVSFTYYFKSTGVEPVQLTDVRPSCGCTASDYTQNLVAPGDKGYVTATYNPANRPGKFNKAITVTTNGTPALIVLRFEGSVVPRVKGPADWYPVAQGNLRFSSNHVSFADVLHTQQDTASVVVYNQGKEAITINVAAMELPKYITFTPENEVLQPKQPVRLHFTYSAPLKNDWGYAFERFKLVTDDKADKTDQEWPATGEVVAEKQLFASAHIKEDFSATTKAGAATPKVAFTATEHNFGKVANNDQLKATFVLENTGAAPLIIRKIKPSCGCTATKPGKTTLAPGERSEIEVSYSTGSQRRPQRKSIAVITNDPAKPETTLWISTEGTEGE
jgi:hypothetical protein